MPVQVIKILKLKKIGRLYQFNQEDMKVIQESNNILSKSNLRKLK